MASTVDASIASSGSFLGWYRRYYLLVNLPILFALTELVLSRYDLVQHAPFNEKDDLAKGFAKYAAHPPAPGDDIMILLGNSAVDRGFDPPTLEAAIGNPHLKIYNFGLKGARLDDESGLMTLLATRGIKPKYVVLGINTYLIDHMVMPDTLYPWLERYTPYIYFHRSRIRTKLWRWIKGLAGSGKKAERPEQDEPIPDTKLPESAVKTFLTQFDRRAVDDFPMVDQLPEFLDAMKRQGIETYVVLLPMAAGGTDKMAAYRPLITRIASKAPADALDLTSAPTRFTDDLFYDVGHPNGAGRVVVTKALVDWLAAKPELHR